uniref:Uncharacterized protein n=1 Tax=Solanum lycopersicum TaxID=4081 RepID=A0A3Q7IJ58_SOLLC
MGFGESLSFPSIAIIEVVFSTSNFIDMQPYSLNDVQFPPLLKLSNEREKRMLKETTYVVIVSSSEKMKGLHVGIAMFTGYLMGYFAFRALFYHSPAMSAAGGILGLVIIMLVETLRV